MTLPTMSQKWATCCNYIPTYIYIHIYPKQPQNLENGGVTGVGADNGSLKISGNENHFIKLDALCF